MDIRQQKYLDDPKYWGLSDKDYADVLRVRIATLEAALIAERAKHLNYRNCTGRDSHIHWATTNETEQGLTLERARRELQDAGVLT